MTAISPLKRFPLGLNAERSLTDGRIVRIGNAAQTLHPVAGQGLNLGLRDAAELVRALQRAPDVDTALRRLEWQRKRLAELAGAHGGVSHGVGAMLNAAAWLYAGGELAAELAAETMDLELFKLAASLTGTARQHELAAWELSARESAVRGTQGEDDISRLRRELGVK